MQSLPPNIQDPGLFLIKSILCGFHMVGVYFIA
jgi:hypothetical protein